MPARLKVFNTLNRPWLTYNIQNCRNLCKNSVKKNGFFCRHLFTVNVCSQALLQFLQPCSTPSPYEKTNFLFLPLTLLLVIHAKIWTMEKEESFTELKKCFSTQIHIKFYFLNILEYIILDMRPWTLIFRNYEAADSW